MIKIKTIFLLLFSLFSFYSCDILRFELFEVASWAPGNGFHSNPENILVSLNFTLEPDRGSVERNFTLTGNESQVRGTFLWSGKKMTFIPLTPLEPNTDYSINLSADARDKKGLSMDESFYREFTTRPSKNRPILISCYPQMYEIIEDTRAEVQLAFNNPISLNTLYSSVSFSPSMTGSWRLENDDTLAIFTPSEPWKYHTRYEIRLTTSLIGINGSNIGNEYLSVFTVGIDNEIPYLLSAQRITKNNEIIDLNAEIINEGWEKEDKLMLIFSKPVDWITVKNNLSVVSETAQDVPSLILEYNTSTTFVFNFNAVPVYESRFIIKISQGINDNTGNTSKEEYAYKVFANGQYSKPPELIGFRMPENPGNTNLQFFVAGKESIFDIIAISNEFYPSNENVSTWIELYFDSVADIDIFSLMENFRIETSNQVINFSPRMIKTDNFSVNDPHAEWNEYKRIEINGYLKNSVNFGIIYLQIGAGLRDILGNKNEKVQVITFIK